MAKGKGLARQAAVPHSTTARHSPDVGLGMLLRDANIAFNRVLRNHLSTYGITFGQFQHLRHLWDEDGLSQVALSDRIGIAKAESTGVLDSLDRLGLIRRERDGSDRRRSLVFLTQKGLDLRPALWVCAKEVNRRARNGLSDAEVATMFELISASAVTYFECRQGRPTDRRGEARLRSFSSQLLSFPRHKRYSMFESRASARKDRFGRRDGWQAGRRGRSARRSIRRYSDDDTGSRRRRPSQGDAERNSQTVELQPGQGAPLFRQLRQSRHSCSAARLGHG